MEPYLSAREALLGAVLERARLRSLAALPHLSPLVSPLVSPTVGFARSVCHLWSLSGVLHTRPRVVECMRFQSNSGPTGWAAATASAAALAVAIWPRHVTLAAGATERGSSCLPARWSLVLWHVLLCCVALGASALPASTTLSADALSRPSFVTLTAPSWCVFRVQRRLFVEYTGPKECSGYCVQALPSD